MVECFLRKHVSWSGLPQGGKGVLRYDWFERFQIKKAKIVSTTRVAMICLGSPGIQRSAIGGWLFLIYGRGKKFGTMAWWCEKEERRVGLAVLAVLGRPVCLYRTFWLVHKLTRVNLLLKKTQMSFSKSDSRGKRSKPQNVMISLLWLPGSMKDE